jgi:signal transduction histidine kinase
LDRQSIIIISVVLGLVLVSIVAYVLYHYFKKVSLLNRKILESHEEVRAQSEELAEANSRLMDLNRHTVEQKEEIQAQAEELTESYQIIAHSNQLLEKKVEERTGELQQAYKELDTFFYRSSHDFRRPLTTFMGLAEVAKVAVKDATALELFEKVNETARNLDRMLVKLQSVSDLGSQELIYKEVFMPELFALIVDKFYDEWKSKNIDIQVEAGLQGPFYSYPALIKIIVENLIENAIQFSTPDKPRIRLKAFETGGEVVIEVTDNGQGIQEQYQGRIFEMYFRGSANSKGNGLGLFIVKKVVDKLKGRVAFQSEPYIGSTFSVFLPASEVKAGKNPRQ